jgi:hypothetical protein
MTFEELWKIAANRGEILWLHRTHPGDGNAFEQLSIFSFIGHHIMMSSSDNWATWSAVPKLPEYDCIEV